MVAQPTQMFYSKDELHLQLVSTDVIETAQFFLAKLEKRQKR